MSELCLSSTPKTTQFSSLLLSDLMLFFSFILSHPLYFSYFIFFSPYLLKLLSFLSPLFVTTSLLLIGFLTVSPGVVHENSPPELSESKAGFLLSTYHAVTERLRSKSSENEDDEFHCFEELEAYKIVFDTSTVHITEKSDEAPELRSEENARESSRYEISGLSISEALAANLEEKTVEVAWEETTQITMEGKSLEGLLKELDEFESMTCYVEEKKVELPGIKSDKAEVKKEGSLARSGSEARDDKIRDGTVKVSSDGIEYTSKVAANSQRFDANVNNTDNGEEYTSKFLESPTSRTWDSNLGSYGSMRKEKEWRRTLACKLFEERNNADGGERMDLLWESYETDSSNKAKPKSNTRKKNKKKSDSECYEDDDNGEEDMDGQLCCLQALKFSAGKMNLGMGRPNLVKFSKAIKGFGWLHHVTRHGKKGRN